jgi:hypothetical protein
MKTLIAAAAFAAVIAAPAFAQSTNTWAWKGASAAPASAGSAYASALSKRRAGVVVSGPIYFGTYKRPNASPASPSFGSNGY